MGLDLGDRSSWYCVLDGTGAVVLEQRLSTTPKAIDEVFGGMPRSRIALETGMHSPWISRWLSELGHEVIVAHGPAHGAIPRKQIEGTIFWCTVYGLFGVRKENLE